jgi:hypothetical protein
MTLGIARGSKKSKSKTRVPSSFSFVYNSSIHCQSRRERSSVDKSHEHCILPRGCPRSHTPPSVRYLTRALEQEGRVNPPIQQKAHAENHVFFGFLIGRWIDPIQLILSRKKQRNSRESIQSYDGSFNTAHSLSITDMDPTVGLYLCLYQSRWRLPAEKEYQEDSVSIHPIRGSPYQGRR